MGKWREEEDLGLDCLLSSQNMPFANFICKRQNFKTQTCIHIFYDLILRSGMVKAQFCGWTRFYKFVENLNPSTAENVNDRSMWAWFMYMQVYKTFQSFTVYDTSASLRDLRDLQMCRSRSAWSAFMQVYDSFQGFGVRDLHLSSCFSRVCCLFEQSFVFPPIKVLE